MSIIRVLPETVALKIAAGEIVDRPASVLRELMDNSIDAGPDRVTVKIEKGGKALIRVADNGCGMTRDDLLLSVERHATSKIRSVSDLERVRTLGFRGEALPSIAAVSRLRLTSRPQDELAGHRLRMDGDRLLAVETTGAPPGTTVEVVDLFFNTPARRKFLAGVQTELRWCADIFARVALPFAHIHCRLDKEDRTILDLPATDDMRSRLGAWMGAELAGAMLTETASGPQIGIQAFLAPPQFARSRADRMLLYVNGRHIRDRFLFRAVMEGYGQQLMKGVYPQALVLLEIDSAQVDMNVHPAKQEVRFQNPRDIFLALRSAVRKAFIRQTAPWSAAPHPSAFPAAPSTERNWVVEAGQPYAPAAAPRARNIPLPSEPEVLDPHELTIIGQLARTYLLGQVGDDLLLVDQHAAHERIVYEELQDALAAAGVPAQHLLLPVTIDTTPDERVRLEQHKEDLARLGLEVEPFGGNTLLVRTLPAVGSQADPRRLLTDMLTVLESGAPDSGALFDQLLKLTACHSAIRAGQSLSPEEMRRLVSDLLKTRLPSNCPHGRPTWYRLTAQDLKTMFKRIGR